MFRLPRLCRGKESLKKITMKEDDYKKKRQYAGPRVKSMKRRKVGHDYQAPCIYMITMVTEYRRPLLGTLSYDEKTLLTDHPKCMVKYSEYGG